MPAECTSTHLYLYGDILLMDSGPLSLFGLDKCARPQLWDVKQQLYSRATKHYMFSNLPREGLQKVRWLSLLVHSCHILRSAKWWDKERQYASTMYISSLRRCFHHLLWSWGVCIASVHVKSNVNISIKVTLKKIKSSIEYFLHLSKLKKKDCASSVLFKTWSWS